MNNKLNVGDRVEVGVGIREIEMGQGTVTLIDDDVIEVKLDNGHLTTHARNCHHFHKMEEAS